LLKACWRTLRPGGQLHYTTCTRLKHENQTQIEAYLQRTADAQAQPLGAQYGHAAGAGRQRFPGEQQCDGFSYALLLNAS
ncbi:16S rRNA (cytosine(967)-C(5))-methyltransferase RsmB, partial [Xanthomonas campestris]